MLAIASNPDRKRQILYLQSTLRFPIWTSVVAFQSEGLQSNHRASTIRAYACPLRRAVLSRSKRIPLAQRVVQILKVARTVADLEGADDLEPNICRSRTIPKAQSQSVVVNNDKCCRGFNEA